MKVTPLQDRLIDATLEVVRRYHSHEMNGTDVGLAIVGEPGQENMTEVAFNLLDGMVSRSDLQRLESLQWAEGRASGLGQWLYDSVGKVLGAAEQQKSAQSWLATRMEGLKSPFGLDTLKKQIFLVGIDALNKNLISRELFLDVHAAAQGKLHGADKDALISTLSEKAKTADNEGRVLLERLAEQIRDHSVVKSAEDERLELEAALGDPPKPSPVRRSHEVMELGPFLIVRR